MSRIYYQRVKVESPVFDLHQPNSARAATSQIDVKDGNRKLALSLWGEQGKVFVARLDGRGPILEIDNATYRVVELKPTPEQRSIADASMLSLGLLREAKK